LIIGRPAEGVQPDLIQAENQPTNEVFFPVVLLAGVLETFVEVSAKGSEAAWWMLTRRPAKDPPAEQVQVQVRHCLAAGVLTVDHQAIAVLDQTELLRQPRRDEVQVPHQRLIVWRQVGVRGDLLARNDQHVDGGLGIDIVEGDTLIVLVDDPGWDFLAEDFEEQVRRQHEVAPFGAAATECLAVQ
jgi:hypothetical protein